MKKIRANRKMTEMDITAAANLLNEWEQRMPRTPLQWSNVEKATGFTRPALSSKREIQDAYDVARARMREVREQQLSASPRVVDALRAQVEALKKENKALAAGEDSWQDTWKAVLFNAQRLGIDFRELTAPIRSARRKHTPETLRAFNGRRRQ